MAENNNVFMIARGELKTDGKILKRTREIMENVCSNVKFLKDNGQASDPHEQESEVWENPCHIVIDIYCKFNFNF